jgi:acetyl-CoA acyltransferase 2
MRSIGKDVFIVSARRTAFGTFGGALKDRTATDLAAVAAEAAIADSGVPQAAFDHVIFGNVMHTAADAIYLARHVGLRCGLPVETPALTVNRLCGSGFQAVVSGAEQIWTDQAEVVLVGGTESMSQAPHIVRGARWGIALGKSQLEDALWSGLTDSHVGLPMAITAENLAVQYEISQADVDGYSIQSQRRYGAAREAGHFRAELCGDLEKDEHPRPGTTADKLAKLPKVFKKDGVIHAGAASGICDGAAALVLVSGAAAKKYGAKPLARVVGWGVAGCDPKIMGIGPAPAIRRLLSRHDLSLDAFELIEVNEAFAPQVLAVMKELSLPADKTNVNGGAIAVGHPLAASGARITTHLVHELQRRGANLGLGSACIGGGQGIALALEAA